jgi:putative oxidoreductase
MTDKSQTIEPIIPAFAPLYRSLARFAEPMMRAAVGLFLMPHGAQKLFGWFGGYGLEGTAGFFAGNLGLEPGIFWAGLVGGVEFFGGLFLALGLLTRPVAVAITVLMAVAVFRVHLGSGFFWTDGGYEYPLMWGLLALGFALRGGDAYSLDRKFGREF